MSEKLLLHGVEPGERTLSAAVAGALASDGGGGGMNKLRAGGSGSSYDDLVRAGGGGGRGSGASAERKRILFFFYPRGGAADGAPPLQNLLFLPEALFLFYVFVWHLSCIGFSVYVLISGHPTGGPEVLKTVKILKVVAPSLSLQLSVHHDS